MSYFEVRRKIVPGHNEPMVLRGDLNLAGLFVNNRLVGTTMTKFHFYGLSTTSERKQLMAETDPKNRCLTDQISDRINGVLKRLGITRKPRLVRTTVNICLDSSRK